MKLTSLFALTLGFSLGSAIAEEESTYSGLYLAYGLCEENGVISGWYDAEKTELTICITADAWNAAYAGDYSDTVTFTVSYEAKA